MNRFYKAALLAVFALQGTTGHAQSTEWKQDILKLVSGLTHTQYEQYDYEVETTLPNADAKKVKGFLYFNKKDSILLHVNDNQTLLITSRYYLKKDVEQKEFVLIDLTKSTAERRKFYLGQAFNTDLVAASMDSTLTRSGKLFDQKQEDGNSIVRFEMGDHYSYNNEVTMKYKAADFTPVFMTFKVTRHTDFQHPSGETDVIQFMRCQHYSFVQDSKMESEINARYEAITKEMANSKDYKIIRL